jgi:hypothetical protein
MLNDICLQIPNELQLLSDVRHAQLLSQPFLELRRRKGATKKCPKV